MFVAPRVIPNVKSPIASPTIEYKDNLRTRKENIKKSEMNLLKYM